MSPLRPVAFAAAFVLLAAGVVHADRRYFLHSHTPYLQPAGNLELETITIAQSGQDQATATGFRNRIEFEYGISDRMTGAAYLNFVQPATADAATTFDGPSLEVIVQLARPGALPIDPAAYLEVRANGSEVEIEPKLLLGRRIYRLMTTMNVAGEIEPHTSGPEKGGTEKAMLVTAGVSREIGHVFAIGLEAVYEHRFEEGADASSTLLGPSINLQTAKVQLALGWQPQIAGSPASSGGLNLIDFPRSEVRLLLGFEL